MNAKKKLFAVWAVIVVVVLVGASLLAHNRIKLHRANGNMAGAFLPGVAEPIYR